MLNSIAFANAATIITAIFFGICAFLSYIAPDFISGIGTSWVHTINLEAIRIKTQPSLVNIVYGLFSISVVTWITSFIFIEVYNKLAKK